MNLLLISPEKLTSETSATIDGDQFLHAKKILKVAVGSTLKVGVLNGKLGTATVNTINEKSLELSFTLTESPTKPLPVRLIVAMARPQTVKKVLSNATVLGVKEIFFIQTKRVEKSYWSSPVLREESLFRHLHEGLQQTVDTVMPMIHFRKRFKPFVEDELPLLLKESTGYVFHPAESPEKMELEPDKHFTFIVGPEGGFIDYEIEKLREAGAMEVSLGSRIMRVEQAVNTILGYSTITLDL